MRVRNALMIAMAAALIAPATWIHAQTAPAKKAPPLRGQVDVEYNQIVKREGNMVVTTFIVRNPSATGSIVGLKVDEFWYDPKGELIQGTGDRQRLKMPLQPGETAELVLHSPVVPNMTGAKPQYKFAQQNGDVKLKPVKTLKPSATTKS